MTTLKTGAAIAAAAAALFSLGGFVTPVHAAEGSVKCAGINSCKGTSECKSATNSCKGMNSCSGQGWVSKKDAAECKAAGGKVL